MQNRKTGHQAFLAHDRAVTVVRMYFRMALVGFFIGFIIYIIGLYIYCNLFLLKPIPEYINGTLVIAENSKKLHMRSIFKYYVPTSLSYYFNYSLISPKRIKQKPIMEKVEPELIILLRNDEVLRETYKLAIEVIVSKTSLNRFSLFFIWSMLFVPSFMIIYFAWFAYRSKLQEKDKHIRGAQLLTFDKMKASLDGAIKKENTNNPVRLGEVLLADSISRLHMLILGTTGTGKSVTLNRLITSLKGNGRTIIYDVKGEFVGKHYNKNVDVIFYPFDKRSIPWNFFNEIESYPDFDVLATSLYQPPKPGSENEYWYGAAGEVFRAVLAYLYQQEIYEQKEEKRKEKQYYSEIEQIEDTEKENKIKEYQQWKNSDEKWRIEYQQWKYDINKWRNTDIPQWKNELEIWEKGNKIGNQPIKPIKPIRPERPDNPINMQYIRSEPRTNNAVWELLSMPVSVMKDKLSYLEYIDKGGLKHIENTQSNQASSIISIVQERLKFFRYLCEEEGEAPGKFSFRKFIREEEKYERLFLMNIQQYESIFRPLMTFVVDIMTREVLSLKDDPARRVTFIIDEFGSLSKLSSIFGFLTMARSKGGFLVTVNQDLGSIAEKYGKEAIKTLFNNYNIHLTFRINDPETSKFLAEAYGEQEVTRKNRSSSFGPSDSGDRFTLNEQDRIEKIILPTELQTLPTFVACLKISNYGITIMKTEKIFTNKQADTPEYLPKNFSFRENNTLQKEQVE